MIGVFFTAQQALLHPMHVVKTRMQVAEHSGVSLTHGVVLFRHIVRNDGIHGLYRGFGTSVIGSLPGKVLALTSLEMSKDMVLRYTQGVYMPEATCLGIGNGVAGMISNLVSCVE